MKKAKPVSVDDSVETCMQCIKDIRQLFPKPNEHGQAIRDACRLMQERIQCMLSTGLQSEGKDLTRLYEDLDLICSLTNQMECGGLMIKMDHAMQAAYRRLP